MATRRLAAFTLPLRHRHWRQLGFDGQSWQLLPLREDRDPQPVKRVQVALELPGRRWLRLQWGRRLWPAELHLWLTRRDFPALWPLIGAALTQSHGRAWLGRD
jgi:hypothetical protein